MTNNDKYPPNGIVKTHMDGCITVSVKGIGMARENSLLKAKHISNSTVHVSTRPNCLALLMKYCLLILADKL